MPVEILSIKKYFLIVSSSEVDIAQSQTVYTRKGRIQASFYVFTTGTGQNVLFKAQWFYVLLENFYPIFRVVLKTWNVLKGLKTFLSLLFSSSY